MKVQFLSYLLLLYTNIRAETDESRLIDELLSDYDQLQRPVKIYNSAVHVNLGLFLQQIIEVNELKQTIRVNAWLNFEWHDYRLTWRPEKYSNATVLRIPSKKIWTPDVLLYNSFDVNFGSTYPVNIVLRSTGHISWIPPCILRGMCKPNKRSFPYNEQLCWLKFGSWTYDGKKINLTSGVFDSTEYLPSGQWTLSDKNVTRTTKTYTCCPDPYIDVQFIMNIRRRSMFHVFCFIGPLIILSLISIVCFLLPCQSKQRVIVGILALVSTFFFALYLNSILPPSGQDLPSFGLFIGFHVVFVSIALLISLLITNFYHRKTCKFPAWVRDLLSSCTNSLKISPVRPNDDKKFLLGPVHNAAPPCTKAYGSLASAADQHQNQMVDLATKMHEMVDYCNSTFSEPINAEQETSRQWKMLAEILDKFCLVVFFAIYVVCTFSFLIGM